MDQRSAGIAAICLLLGTSIIFSIPYLVWQPTVNAPNYWENHTDGLLDLVFLAIIGGGFVVAGFAIGFERSTLRSRARSVRITGISVVLGSLLASLFAYPRFVEVLPPSFGRGAPAFFGVRATAFILLTIGVAGCVTNFRATGRRAWYGAGVIAGGISLLAGVELLRWGLNYVWPKTGLVHFQTLGLTLAGALAIAIGSVILGWALRRNADASNWYGSLLIGSGLFALPLGGLAVLGYYEGIGFYGIVWLLISAHLLLTSQNPTFVRAIG